MYPRRRRGPRAPRTRCYDGSRPDNAPLRSGAGGFVIHINERTAVRSRVSPAAVGER